MAARIARAFYLIQFAETQPRQPRNAAKGAKMAEVFGNQPAREGFIIRQAPIRGSFGWVGLMR